MPEVKGAQTVGLTLLHLELADRLPPDVARSVLSGYRHRYTALRGAITETEPELDDTRLADVPVVDLLTLPIAVARRPLAPVTAPPDPEAPGHSVVRVDQRSETPASVSGCRASAGRVPV